MGKENNEGSILGTTGMIAGGIGILALSTIDGGLLTVLGCGALGYGAGLTVSKAMMPRDEDGERTDRYERDLGITRYVVAGSCGIATFMNPFIGIPGTILLLLFHNSWRNEAKATVDNIEAERAERAMHSVSRQRQAMFC